MHKRPKWSSFRLWRAVTKWAPAQSMRRKNLASHLQSHLSEWIKMKTWDRLRVNRCPSGSRRASRFVVPLEVQIKTVPTSTTWRIALSILKSRRLSTTESSVHTARGCSQMTRRRGTFRFVKGMRNPANLWWFATIQLELNRQVAVPSTLNWNANYLNLLYLMISEANALNLP